MVCAAVLSAGLAISSLPAGALAVHAEENTQVQEVTAETGTAGTDKAGVESAEPQPSAAPEANAEETAPVEAEPAAETAPADQEVAAEPVTETTPVVVEGASATPSTDTASAAETETTADVETATETEQQAAASLPAPDETPADDVVTSAPVATEAPEIEVSADKAADAALSEAAPEETVESEALAENTEVAAEAQTPGEPTALTELATKAEAVAAKEQAGETQENSAADEAATSKDSASEKAAEESVSENNTADMEDSTPAAEAGSTDTEEMASEEDAAENSSDAEEEVSPALALRMLAVSADAAAGALGENVDSSSQGSGETVHINYDGTIHSIGKEDENTKLPEIILYCMNNMLHWPHSTLTITAPDYKQVDAQKVNLSSDLQEQIKILLYAGYPDVDNDSGLFKIVDQEKPLDIDDYNKLLDAPEWIRKKFPDTIGSTIFSYNDFKEQGENYNKLSEFMQKVYKPHDSQTPSESYADIFATPFYKAVQVLLNTNNPLVDYAISNGNPFENFNKSRKSIYQSISNVIWFLMKQNNIPNNNIEALPKGVNENESKTLEEKLYEYSQDKNNAKKILTSQSINTNVTITGESSFKKTVDNLWKTGPLRLNASVNKTFTLNLPNGVFVEGGGTEIKPGTDFFLVTNTEPSTETTITANANVILMDGDLKIYTPASENSTASDNKGFQNMIGALIRKTQLSAAITLLYEPKSTEEPKNPTQGDNNTPSDENPSGPNEETPATPTDPSTPETPPAEDTDPGTPDNTTDNKNTEPTDPVTNNTTESSDPVETNTTPGTDPVVTNNTHSSDPVVTRTTVGSTPTATNTTTAAEPAVISAAAVSAPVVTDTTTATAPQIVSTPVSNGEPIVTGDESQMGLYLTLFAAAAAGLAVWFAGKHKKNFR